MRLTLCSCIPNRTTHTKKSMKSYASISTGAGAETVPKPRRTRAAHAPHQAFRHELPSAYFSSRHAPARTRFTTFRNSEVSLLNFLWLAITRQKKWKHFTSIQVVRLRSEVALSWTKILGQYVLCESKSRTSSSNLLVNVDYFVVDVPSFFMALAHCLYMPT